MLQVEMSASVRKSTGKGPMRQLRMAGKTPAVVYGGGLTAMPLEMESKTLMQKLLGIIRRNAVVTLKIDGESDRHVLLGEVQTDPVRDTLIHADFCEIDLKKTRRFNVPVVFTGLAKGVDFGGEMFIEEDSVVLEGLPLDIPDECSLDVTELRIGDELNFGNISLPETLKLISDADTVCVKVDKKLGK
jgi:large subunit ribosomal protein L25